MKNSEQKYIDKRKRLAFLNSLCYLVCRVFPIKKNRIAVCTFEGKGGFGCNPKYIVEELHRRNPEYEFVWIVDDLRKEFPDYIKPVKNTQWSRAYWLSTSKIWIDNYRRTYGTKKRKNQYYINTWHGTLCIKPIGKYRGDLFPKIACLISEADSKLIDYVLSGSGWCDKHYRDGLVYDGEIIRTGSPRCDILMKDRKEIRNGLKSQFGIPQDAKVLMYAPTFRGGSQNTSRSIGTGEMQIDFEALIHALESQFGGTWYILLRLHPQLAAKNQYCKTSKDSERLKDVTQYPDMNELMAGIDAFITDYSSAIFEACLMKIPCFIYADDLEEYIKERGDLFFDMKELPFPVAMENKTLIENVEKFDMDEYIMELEAFIKEQDITEDGHASERVADLIGNL